MLTTAYESLEDQLLRRMVADLNASTDTGWRKYIDPDPVRWITTHFYIPETKRPIDLYPSQIAPLREALSLDENGNFKYSTVVWGAIKKSAKSSIAAAICLWMMFQDEWRSGKIIANDMKQAQSRVFSYAKRAISLHPEWRSICRITQTHILLPNHSVIEAIPMDPEGEAGGNDDFVSYTEVWAWKSEKAKRMWTESTLSPTKFGKSLRWLDTYAGFSGESVVLEPLFAKAVQPERIIDAENDIYAVPEARLMVLWNTRPKLPFQTPEYYAQEETSLTPNEFNRVHKNEWASSEEAFVPMEWWSGCQTSTFPQFRDDDPMILVADAAVTGDTFGLLGVSGDGNGNYYPRYVNGWVPPKGGRIDFSQPEAEIRRLCDRYNIIEFALDEYQLADMAERLERDLVVNIYRFPQGKQRAVADKRLFDSIRDRHVRHRGDELLTKHVENANRKAAEDKMLRIIKRADHLKIDLCVCLSMAVDRAVSWNL